ncbi:septum formation initiator family protein [Flavicella sp.]|uniref:FtsB family cell division protein n=1 Tax=Flavicella sp. TaxID=2957742 RepID=UPI0026259976|nr:septum formation initiator family protein [Flavicella sp.]MDG1803490.1 septum formation initiator family protein [Flavicella sp.]
MKLIKKIQQNKTLKILTNSYVLILIVFCTWMLFFDENSYLNHREYNQEIKELKNSIEFYKKEIEHNKKMIEALNDPEQLEKYAREIYRIKKEDETLYLIEFDTIK